MEHNDCQVSDIRPVLRSTMQDVEAFIQEMSGCKLRDYQRQVAETILDSIIYKRGLTIVVIFPRQSGKNELQAQIEAYLLAIYQRHGAEMIKVSPTWKPQALNSMRRLQKVLGKNLLLWANWKKENNYIYAVGSARIFFLSGAPGSSVVGATASTLLECDEAQDVQIAKWDKDFAPMAASTNATRVFWGTMWTSRTLLNRELSAAREAEKEDGLRRVFLVGADEVAREVPSYAIFIKERVARLGRNHPMVKTQFFSELIDEESGMFPERRIALMLGDHPRRLEPEVGKVYAFLIDVAGEELSAISSQPSAISFQLNLWGEGQLQNPRRDSTALTIVEVGLETVGDPIVQAPTYRAVQRMGWTGESYSRLYSQILSLAETWKAQRLVIDATGVGAGLASFLGRALPGRVIPFTFNSATKSKLGWDFLAVVETGRWKEWGKAEGERMKDEEESREWRVESSNKAIEISFANSNNQAVGDGLQANKGIGGSGYERGEFLEQLRVCQMEIMEGPEQRLKWGVPDGTRSPVSGRLVHDDWIISAALCAELDQQEWSPSPSPAVVIPRGDPLEEMDREGF